MDRYLAVILGAALGGLSRYVLGTAITSRYGGSFPLGTFAINVSGCFLIGLATTLLTDRPNWRLFLVVGVLGGYTTFSSFGLETLETMRRGDHLMALGYATGSVVFGYLAVWLGTTVLK